MLRAVRFDQRAVNMAPVAYNGGVQPPSTLLLEYVAACDDVNRTTQDERWDRLIVAPDNVLLPYSAARQVSSRPSHGLQPAAVIWLSIEQLM